MFIYLKAVNSNLDWDRGGFWSNWVASVMIDTSTIWQLAHQKIGLELKINIMTIAC